MCLFELANLAKHGNGNGGWNLPFVVERSMSQMMCRGHGTSTGARTRKTNPSVTPPNLN